MRNKLHTCLIYVALCTVFAFAAARDATAAPLSLLFEWGDMSDSFVRENQRLEGTWKDHADWQARLCNGHYDYVYSLRGDIGKVDFELNDQGTVDVYADVSNIFVNGNGHYRSPQTLCIPLKGWFGVTIDSAHIHSLVSFTGTGQSLKDMKIRIIETNLGTIHVGSAVPGWLERFLTRQMNRALGEVWTSHLGEWLSEKITEAIRRQLPERPTP